jgi:HD-like signal output (HDOD) protein
MKGFFQSSMRLDVLRSIWRHSLACAIVSEELSEACSPTQSRDDRAYTTGLLHDIGRLGLFVVHPQAYAELLLAKNPTEDIRERERKAFGFDHCEAGGWLAANWGLPEDVQKIASGHHDTPDATASLENLVRVGILLTDSFGFDVTPPARVYTLAEVRSFLPRSAQYRFDPDPEELKTRITVKLDAYD